MKLRQIYTTQQKCTSKLLYVKKWLNTEEKSVEKDYCLSVVNTALHWIGFTPKSTDTKHT